jgi:adenosine deaminase
LYETLFVQYLRVKTAVFRLLVHAPGEDGLENFLPHFQQIKVYAPEADVLRPRPPNEPGLTIKGTEYRVAPDAWLKILRRGDSRIEEVAVPVSPPAEAAWLIHFKRDAHDKGLPLHGSSVRRMESEADQIARALAAKPECLRTLRGIDICGVEEAQPLWVSAETLRRLRLRSSDIAIRHPSLFLKPLRLTLHVGEDFKWLTTGVRAIAEPFHWHLIERGDRIGHGIAITFDPVEWWTRPTPKDIKVKRIDRLLDLGFLAEYAERRTVCETAWLRSEIKQLLKIIWPQSQSEKTRLDPIESARGLWLTFGLPLVRTLLETRYWPENKNRPYEKWIHSYFWNPTVRDRAHDKILLSIRDRRRSWFGGARNERDLLVKARARLIGEVARLQVCIESNPSSNLVVGGLDAIGAAQDFLQQRPTLEAGKTLTWTISTDDPITFSTTLADEYAYAWAGMVLRQEHPYDPAYARALLDEAAATSVRMRFTIQHQDREDANTNRRRGGNRARRA